MRLPIALFWADSTLTICHNTAFFFIIVISKCTIHVASMRTCHANCIVGSCWLGFLFNCRNSHRHREILIPILVTLNLFDLSNHVYKSCLLIKTKIECLSHVVNLALNLISDTNVLPSLI